MAQEIKIRPKKAGDEAAAAHIAIETFGDKYTAMCGSNLTGMIAMAQEEMTYRGKGDNLLLAEVDGEVVGMMEILSIHIPYVPDGTLIELRLKHLGLAQGMKAVFMMSFLGRAMADDECSVSQLGVLPKARKKGVARRLLTYGLEFARLHEKKWLTLWVAENNENAIKLYKDFGFEIATRSVSKSSERFFNIPVWLKMRMATGYEG